MVRPVTLNQPRINQSLTTNHDSINHRPPPHSGVNPRTHHHNSFHYIPQAGSSREKLKNHGSLIAAISHSSARKTRANKKNPSPT
jgi:hypothetical protein